MNPMFKRFLVPRARFADSGGPSNRFKLRVRTIAQPSRGSPISKGIAGSWDTADLRAEPRSGLEAAAHGPGPAGA